MGLKFPKDLLYLVKYFQIEDIFLVWRRYELGNTHNPNASKAEVEVALKGQEKVHIVDHRQGTAYGAKSPVFAFRAEYAEDFLTQVVIPELPEMGITAIRLLPMGKEEFPAKKDVDNFLLHDLKYDGLYYYRKKSFTNDPYDRIFVLFQYDGHLIGCGERVFQKREQRGDYSGYYEFNKNTVLLFNRPITAGDFLPLVDNSICGFSQALQKIDIQYLESIVSYIDLNRTQKPLSQKQFNVILKRVRKGNEYCNMGHGTSEIQSRGKPPLISVGRKMVPSYARFAKLTMRVFMVDWVLAL